MKTMTAGIVELAGVGKEDVGVAGGKGANLGELMRAGFPVPPGFVVTAAAYLDAMAEGGVRDALLGRLVSLDPDDDAALDVASKDLQAMVRDAGVPPHLRAELLDAYHRLEGSVAVRSSATSEDTASASFAGMNETFTNVTGDDELVERVVDCWASLWGRRVVSYRASRGITEEPAIAVVVQRMIDSERSGVAFCADPSTGDTSRIVVEAAFGLGEVVVGGQVEPDTYLLDKAGPRLLEARVGRQTHKVVRGADGHDQRVELGDAGAERILTDDEVLELARLASRVEAHYGTPQDIEWAITGGKLYLLQSRPITTL